MIYPKIRQATLDPIAFIIAHLRLVDAYYFIREALSGPFALILIYHRVSPESPPWPSDVVSPGEFEREMSYLSKVAEVVPFDLLVSQLAGKKILSRRIVAITFDDGYEDNYRFAYPILRKYNLPATIFLTTGYIGSSALFWWDKIRFAIWDTDIKEFGIDGVGKYYLNSISDRLFAMGEIEDSLKYLTTSKRSQLIDKLLEMLKVNTTPGLGKEFILSWDEILEMNRGGISFGAHTVSHPILTSLPIEEAKFEISCSKKDIEEKLGKPVTAFSFPNGAFNTELIRVLEESGFSYAVTTVSRVLTSRSNPYVLGRIPTGWNLNTFKASLSGLYPDLVTVLNWLKGRSFSLDSKKRDECRN